MAGGSGARRRRRGGGRRTDASSRATADQDDLDWRTQGWQEAEEGEEVVPQQHPLERRSALLAGKLKDRVSSMTQSLTAAQGRIPFRTKLPEAQALDWWSKHRYDDIGEKALELLDPMSIARLDSALTQYAQQQEALGMPQVVDP